MEEKSSLERAGHLLRSPKVVFNQSGCHKMKIMDQNNVFSQYKWPFEPNALVLNVSFPYFSVSFSVQLFSEEPM